MTEETVIVVSFSQRVEILVAPPAVWEDLSNAGEGLDAFWGDQEIKYPPPGVYSVSVTVGRTNTWFDEGETSVEFLPPRIDEETLLTLWRTADAPAVPPVPTVEVSLALLRSRWFFDPARQEWRLATEHGDGEELARVTAEFVEDANFDALAETERRVWLDAAETHPWNGFPGRDLPTGGDK